MRIVKGRNVDHPIVARQPRGMGLGLVLRAAVDVDLCTKRADAVDFGLRHKVGHTDHGAQALLRRRIGHGATVVAGGTTGHASGPIRHMRHRIHRPAQFERPHRLANLKFEPEIAPELLRQVRGHKRRAVGHAFDHLLRGQNIR